MVTPEALARLNARLGLIGAQAAPLDGVHIAERDAPGRCASRVTTWTVGLLPGDVTRALARYIHPDASRKACSEARR